MNDPATGSVNPKPTVPVPPQSTGRGADPAVLARARRGDDAAFAQILAHHDAALRAVAYRLTGEPDAVDTVLSQAYLKAYRNLPRLPDRPGPWLLRLVTVASFHRLRRRAHHRALPIRGRSAPPPDDLGSVAGNDGPLARALADLPLDQRTIVLLVQGEGLDTAAVGALLGIPPDEVERRRQSVCAALAAPPPGPGAGSGPALVAAIRSLPVPGHRPDFWEELAAVLRTERSRETPPLGAIPLPADRSARARPGLAETVGDLAHHARKRRTPRGSPRRFALGLLAVLVIGGSVIAVLALSGEDRLGEPAPATTAADVADEVLDAMADREVLRATSRTTVLAPGGEPSTTVARLTRLADGSFAHRSVDGPAVTTYQAGTGRVRSVFEVVGPDGTPDLAATDLRGLAAGAPDPSANRTAEDEALAIALRALATDPERPVAERQRTGVDVWVVDVTAPPGAALAGSQAADRLRVVVDRRLGLPVQIVATRAGTTVWELVLEDVVVDEAPPPGELAVAIPGRVEVDEADFGFQRVTLDAIGEILGARAVRPAYLPPGFELAEVAVRPGTAPSPGVGNPDSADTVSISYRRGVQQVVVSTRTSRVGAGRWSDPFAVGPAGEVPADGAEPPTVELAAGRFAGTTAEVVTDAGTPHLWGTGDDLVFTVAGDLTARQLVRVAESLG